MQNSNTPNQKIVAKFLKNKTALLSLSVIILFAIIALFAYVIIPDNSPNANLQNPSLALKSPGFRMKFIRLKKEITQSSQSSNFMSGIVPDEKLVPINDFQLSENGSIKIAEFKGEGFPDIEYEIEKSRLKYPNDVHENIVSKTYLFGTDNLGRDVFSRLMLGSRVSLSVGFIAVLISSIIGIFLGAIAGFYRSWIDRVIMWKMSVFWAIPTLLLSMTLYISLKDFFESSFTIIFISIGLTMWVSMARMVRGQVMALRESQFVEAVGSMGFSDIRIIGKHVLPNVFGIVIVIVASTFANAILIEAGLSFLGLGVQPPIPSWGGMLNEYKDLIGTNLSYLALLPGFCIMVLVLCFNLFGYGLRDALDLKN